MLRRQGEKCDCAMERSQLYRLPIAVRCATLGSQWVGELQRQTLKVS
ncbi:hypothetical protein [Phormidium sp. CCY1219]|nr:hypothetical protein [Phormidium sp. CCY1219]MEB3826142.1 hypothetical protein [Phormidium sp. CCY1219]